ncbi:MAG: zinc ABC transporter substrate-binding protein [Nitrospirota bacterium]
MSRSIIVGILIFLLPACIAPKSNTLRVVATYSILGDIVRQVGKGQVTLDLIVGPNQDMHTFEPTPKSLALIAGADLVFENGLNFEPWLDKLYKSSESKARRVVVTNGIVPFSSETGENDPHLWHDVHYAIEMTKTIEKALSKHDPKNETLYQANANAYIARLTALQAWVFEKVQTIPKAERVLVTTHDSFGYFARRYQFETMGISTHTTEASDPSAAEFIHLIETIKRLKITAIFTENVTRSKTMETIANETGAKIVSSLYTDALSDTKGPADSYEKLIRHNVETITRGLLQ